MATLKPLAAPIDALAQKIVGKDWPLYAQLLGHWREIVGEEFAQTTTPVKVSLRQGAAHQEGGTLHIRLPDGARMQFTLMTPTILQRIATLFGHAAIARLVLEPFFAAPPAADAAADETAQSEPTPLPETLKSRINDIENNELKEILLKLGESVMHDRAKAT